MWITESSIIKARNVMRQSLMFPAAIPKTIDVTVAIIIAKPKILAANLINANKNGPTVIASPQIWLRQPSCYPKRQPKYSNDFNSE
jgi:hypothetical protein